MITCSEVFVWFHITNTGDALWVLPAASRFVWNLEQNRKRCCQNSFADFGTESVSRYPIFTFICFTKIMCPLNTQLFWFIWSLLDLIGRFETSRSLFGSPATVALLHLISAFFNRQNSELWLIPVSRCQEIPGRIPLSASRNYTMILWRSLQSAKLSFSKAFCPQLYHLWCMFLPSHPFLFFKLTLSAYCITALSLKLLENTLY